MSRGIECEIMQMNIIVSRSTHQLLDLDSLRGWHDPFSNSLCTLTLGLNLCNEFAFSFITLRLALVLHCRLLGRDTRTILAVFVVSAKNAVAPPERGRKVVCKGHVVEIVVLSARPEGDDVLQRPGEV
jgi:hypothetical protein